MQIEWAEHQLRVKEKWHKFRTKQRWNKEASNRLRVINGLCLSSSHPCVLAYEIAHCVLKVTFS